MFEEKLKEIFSKYPGKLGDRARFLGLLRDYFPDDRLHTNLLMMAFDVGIYIVIEKAPELDNIAFGRFEKILISNYGIGEDNADWCVKTWFDAYGSFLGKKNSCSYRTAKPQNKKEISPEKNCTRAPKAAPTPKKSTFVKGNIDLANYTEGQKLPKSILHRDETIEKEYGFDAVNFTISKDYWSDSNSYALSLVGELYGSKLKYDDTVLVFTVYNDRGELIGTNFDEEIWKRDFKGYHTLSQLIEVPSDEIISEIRFRPILDPCFADD